MYILIITMAQLNCCKVFSHFIMLIQKTVFFWLHHAYLSLEFLISSFTSSYYFSTLSIEINTWLLFESIKAFLWYLNSFCQQHYVITFSLLFLIIKIFNSHGCLIPIISITVGELAIPTGIPTEEAKA